METEAASRVLEVVTTIAAKEADWGGYTGPVVGLLSIFAIILVLSPPLKD